MKFHHTACLVDSIEEALKQYKLLLQDQFIVSEIYSINDQKVKVCFILLANDDIHLELVEPLEGNDTLKRMLKKGSNFYHIAFKVENIESEIKRLTMADFRSISTFKSEAFHDKLCAFLISTDNHLLELIEA